MERTTKKKKTCFPKTLSQNCSWDVIYKGRIIFLKTSYSLLANVYAEAEGQTIGDRFEE